MSLLVTTLGLAYALPAFRTQFSTRNVICVNDVGKHEIKSLKALLGARKITALGYMLEIKLNISSP